MRRILCFLFFLVVILGCQGKSISPLDWGFNQANTSVERFYILHAVHLEAVKMGVDVNYSGMPKEFEIEIPINATSICLTENNNFKGITIHVLNKQKEVFLFERKGFLSSIELSKKEIDNADFRNDTVLNEGKCLLIIEDTNIWTERIGYDYSVKRKDILLLEGGKGKNRVIQPYNNAYSSPKCSYRCVNNERTIVRNLTIIRSKESTEKTYGLQLVNLNDIEIKNVNIGTSESNMYGDMAINIMNCTNVLVKDVNISGTYSQANKYGYGIHMNNVYNSYFERLKASASWGVFGTNNMNFVKLEDCDINRFDIHCYGKNVYCKNVTFRTLYNQFSSFYGELTFKKCRFKNFIPVLLEPSFNAYTNFQLNMINCKWEIAEARNYLLYAGQLGDVSNKRTELTEKWLPSILLKNLKVSVPMNVREVYLFKPETVSSNNTISPSKIVIDGLEFICPQGHKGIDLKFSTKDIQFEGEVTYTCKRIQS